MLSSYIVAKIWDKILKDTNFTVTVPYISLHTASPSTNGANEVTAGSEGGSYARQSCASWDTSLPRSNTSVVTWTNTPDAVVTHFGIWDAVSGGNFLMGGELTISLNIFLGETVRFSAGRLSVNCESKISAYLQPKILDKILKNTDFTVSDAYVSLHSSDPGSTGTAEVTYAARQTFDFGSYTLSSPALVTNTWTVEYVVSALDWSWTAMDDGAVTYIGMWDASTSGNFLMSGQLSNPLTLTGGAGTSEVALGFAVGSDTAFFRLTQVP